ncbi:invasion associated locus B family protein [Roseibium sp. M-1]
MMKAKSLVLAIAGLAVSSAAAFAQTPTLLKQHKDWAAYSLSSGGGKVCYALTKPTTSLPGDRNHGDVFFFVTTRPAEGVSTEPSLLVGYPFKDKSSVTVDIDGKGFTLFTNNDGAWVENAATEAQLVAAMKAGRDMSVSGESSRGTRTSYKFSLSGVTAAIDEANSACR